MIPGFKVKMLSGALVLAMGVLLTGCGGDDSSVSTTTPTSTILSGTAAGGAAIIGSVTVKDSAGAEKSGLIDTSGHYAIDVSGMKAPFVLRADGKVGDTRVTYYSAATTTGNINITQFTDLIVANIANQLAETFFANFSSEAGKLTGDALSTAETALQAKLQPVLSALGLDASIDLLRASFSADHTGLDAALDLVHINYDGNTASLVNTLNDVVLGTDIVTTNADDSSVIDSSKISSTTIQTAVAAATDISTWLKNFTALFATGMPSEAQLSASGLLDTSAHFMDMGQSYDQFSGEVITMGDLVGMAITNSAITFTNPEQTIARVSTQMNLKDGSTETWDFQLEKQWDGTWKYVGDQRIADIEFEALAVNNVNLANGASSMYSGLHLWLDAEDYNANANLNTTDTLEPIAYAVVTGPGLPTAGVKMIQQSQNAYFTVEGNNWGNQVPDCNYQNTIAAACVTIADTVDNGAYTVRLFSASHAALNGSGYVVKLDSPKPLASSDLSSSMFQTITSMTVNGIALTDLSQFISTDTTLGVTWTLPAGMTNEYIKASGWSSGVRTVSVGEDLTEAQTHASLALGATSSATSAGLWLSGHDPHGRMFAVSGYYF